MPSGAALQPRSPLDVSFDNGIPALRPGIDVVAPRPAALPTLAELTVANVGACSDNHSFLLFCIFLATTRLTARAVASFYFHIVPVTVWLTVSTVRGEFTKIVVVRHPRCQEPLEEAMLLAPRMGRRTPTFGFEYELSATTAAR